MSYHFIPEWSRVCMYCDCDGRKQVLPLGVKLCMFRGTGLRLVSKVKITSRLRLKLIK